jgi:ADP-ribosyl-[dinitrogen reductase] hydrolase
VPLPLTTLPQTPIPVIILKLALVLATSMFKSRQLMALKIVALRHQLEVLQQNAKRLATAILANTNAGSDNVHRGMILGILLGAANQRLPEDLKSGLIAIDENVPILKR